MKASSQKVDAIFQVRASKKRAIFVLPNPSAIFKTPHSKPVKVGFLGCEGDEHGSIGHGGPDKALMHYPSQNYKSWKEELPENTHLFTVGGFGENIVSKSVSENGICIGDILYLGKEVLL
jgi:MOSC domain-containing protein YiiM